jgi:hypothetical protein
LHARGNLAPPPARSGRTSPRWQRVELMRVRTSSSTPPTSTTDCSFLTEQSCRPPPPHCSLRRDPAALKGAIFVAAFRWQRSSELTIPFILAAGSQRTIASATERSSASAFGRVLSVGGGVSSRTNCLSRRTGACACAVGACRARRRAARPCAGYLSRASEQSSTGLGCTPSPRHIRDILAPRRPDRTKENPAISGAF